MTKSKREKHYLLVNKKKILRIFLIITTVLISNKLRLH